MYDVSVTGYTVGQGKSEPITMCVDCFKAEILNKTHNQGQQESPIFAGNETGDTVYCDLCGIEIETVVQPALNSKPCNNESEDA